MNAFASSVFAILIAAALLPSAVGAQTCAAPLLIIRGVTHTGNSCGQNLLPSLNHGTLLMPGDDVVYHLLADPSEWGADLAVVTSKDPNFHPALFLCNAPCGSDSQCFSATDSGSANSAIALIPYDQNDYYLIIDSRYGCGDYLLTVNGNSGEPDANPDLQQ